VEKNSANPKAGESAQSMSVAIPVEQRGGRVGSSLEVLLVFAKLGVTCFGGPIAHLGYFRDELVVRRRWLDDQAYGDLVALCQFLPGPASSQVGISIGILRAGLWGGLAAWIGFTLPSAVALILFAYGVAAFGGAVHAGWLHGLKVVAVAVVAQAVWGMAKTFCPDRARITLALIAAIGTLAWPTSWGQIAVIAGGGLVGWRGLSAKAGTPSSIPLRLTIGRKLAVGAWAVFFGLLLLLPILASLVPLPVLAVIDGFYRAGSLVFGGGHVVLPLLQAQVVPPGWIGNDLFLAGYGAAQAVPGPLFTFAAYLGTLMVPEPNGWLGGVICLAAIFLPSFLLVVGALPFWESLRAKATMQAILKGVNAAVVGLLLAALYYPVWTSAIRSSSDIELALAAFGLLVFWNIPPWLVVALSALGAMAVSTFHVGQ
jgi:chromate transporter